MFIGQLDLNESGKEEGMWNGIGGKEVDVSTERGQSGLRETGEARCFKAVLGFRVIDSLMSN